MPSGNERVGGMKLILLRADRIPLYQKSGWAELKQPWDKIVGVAND